MPAKRTTGHAIQDEGTTLAQAHFLNFVGSGIAAATAAGVTTVTDSGIPATIVDAKGDLIVATAADTVARKAVGATNGMHLEAQSAQGDGLLWTLPPGYEFEYQEITAPVTISATTAATANTCITADAVSLDGSTRVCVEVMSPQVQTGATANSEVLTAIWDAVDGGAATDLGRIHYLGRGDGTRGGYSGILERFFLTPAAGSHVFSVRAYRTNSNGTWGAGAGGSDTNVAAYIRITKAQVALSNLIWWPWFGVGGGAPPVVPGYNPVGDTGPIRRGRKRYPSDYDIEGDLEAIAVILSEP